MRLVRQLWLSVLFLVALAPCSLSAQIRLVPGMTIRRGMDVRSGSYDLRDLSSGVVRVTGRDFTIDFHGARLNGAGTGDGVGIHITDARNVTIRNAIVTGYRWGIVVERSIGVKLEHCTSSANANLSPGTVIDESGREPEDQHGGGIVVRDSLNGLVSHCVARNEWDGIDVVRSTGWVIEDGDFSYNGNWGLHLWDSSHNTFRGNRAVWCTTGGGHLYQALTGWQTYDAQAVGIDHNSNENLIEGNDLRFGGDAIYIRANEGPITPGTVVPPRNGSHRNRLIDNDCSFSPNNAIEVDLVDGTVIEGNNCSNSHYGMWLGYSRNCVIRRNTCIDDTAHAVEIENGSGDLFENNVFGNTILKKDGQLIYLRQNGRDTTPSTGYVLRNNLFYGASVAVFLKATGARLDGNYVSNGTELVDRDMPGPQVPETAVTIVAGGVVPEAWQRTTVERIGRPVRLTSGAHFSVLDSAIGQFKLRGQPYNPRHSVSQIGLEDLPWVPPVGRVGGPTGLGGLTVPPVVAVDGIPVWVRSAESGGWIICQMPNDFWDRPARSSVDVSVRWRRVEAYWSMPVAWPTSGPRINAVTPNPARIGDRLTITGVGLKKGGRLLLNGLPVAIQEQSPDRVVVRLPDGILTSKRYNLVYERGKGVDLVRTWPIIVAVDVAPVQVPHLVTASFRPTTLHVGELLEVSFTLRNNLPVSAPLTMRPAPPFSYDETQSWQDLGIVEQPGTLQLRVTSDHPGSHEPGSWPFLFGFAKHSLDAGETVTVTGTIRVRTPGTREFRVGLVDVGGRFIDDNAFRTQITVLP